MSPRPPGLLTASLLVTLVGAAALLAFAAARAPHRPDAVSMAAALVLVGVAATSALAAGALAGRAERARRAAAAAEAALREARVQAAAADDRADEANRVRDEFLATLSHELRTPLNAVLGWVQIIQAGAVEGDQRDKALETVARNGRALARLVDDLLDVSQIVSGKLRLRVEPVDVATTVAAAVDTLAPAARLKKIALEVDVAPDTGAIAADPARLQQIVWNLVSNGVKFTPPGGNVWVRAARGSDEVRLEVADNGKGMSGDFLQHAFDRFRQADPSATRSQSGLGLGLSIVRHLVELHGGTVEARSDGLGTGTSIVVRLPCTSAPDAPARHEG